MNAKALAPWVLYLGLLVAMVGGAPWPRPNWLAVAAGVAIVGGGIAWKRAGERAQARRAGAGPYREGAAVDDAAPGTLAAARRVAPGLVEEVRQVAAGAVAGELPAVAAAVDALHARRVAPIADAQEDVVRRHGFQAWATVMAPLATGERLLYRAWSAASDGHRGEALWSLREAVPHVEEAARALEALS